MHTYTIVHVSAPRRGEKIGQTPPKVEKIQAWNSSYALHKNDGRNLTQEELQERAERK